MSSKTVLVFGASGTIGLGVVKSCLDTGGIKVIGVFRSEESAKKARTRLRDPPADQYVTVVGSFDSEKSVEELQKNVLAKVGAITDVVASIGAGGPISSLLEMSSDDLGKLVYTDKLLPHFLIAKYFLPLIQDKQGTSYTFINGVASDAIGPLPNMGHLFIASGTENKLARVMMKELCDKSVRINEFEIAMYVASWDDQTVPESSRIDNLQVGRAILGLIVHPNAKGECMLVRPDKLERLAQTGTL